MIEGSGENFRDFIHVKDIGRGLILGYQSSVHGMVINLGSGQTYSVNDVANLVSSNQVHVAPRKNDLLGTLADTCLAKRLLRFQTSYDFVATMKAMIADAQAGKSEYLAEMWAEPAVVAAVDERLPGWSSLTPLERSNKIKDSLHNDGLFLDRLS